MHLNPRVQGGQYPRAPASFLTTVRVHLSSSSPTGGHIFAMIGTLTVTAKPVEVVEMQ